MSVGEDGYVAVGLLARGGMGEVELGMRRAGSFERMVAIKRLRPEFREDEAFRAMFLEEARIAGLLRHPNVVPVIDVGEDGRGPFLVMDFVEGLTVSKILRNSVERGRHIPLQIALRIVQQVAEGLSAAHELERPDGTKVELIHRDISPQNVLVGFDGVARLTDFGIAKALGVSRETTTGMLKGKAGYMAPEQLRFDPPSQRSDLFALGVVLFELVAGRRLYGGKNSAMVAKRVLDEPAPDLYSHRADAPAELVELTFELLAKDPAIRPASAREVARRLRDIADDCASAEGAERIEDYLREHFETTRTEMRTRSASLVQAWREESTAQAARARSGKRRWLWIVAAALVLAGVGLALLPAGADEAPRVERAVEVQRTETVSAPPVRAEAPSAMPVQAEPEEPSPAPPPAAEAAPRMRRRTRRRPSRMRPSMDEGFSAIDLIRGNR